MTGDNNFGDMMAEIEADNPDPTEKVRADMKKRHNDWEPDCDPSQNGGGAETGPDVAFPGDDALGPGGI